jgi:hypothetical protein
MKQYEYNVLTNRYHIKEEVLNLLGKEGWELVSHTYTDKSQSIEDEHVYTFKREIVEEPVRKFKLDDSFRKALEEAVVSDTPASSWMDEYYDDYIKLQASGMMFEFHPTWTGHWDRDKWAFCHDRKYKKLSPQEDKDKEWLLPRAFKKESGEHIPNGFNIFIKEKEVEKISEDETRIREILNDPSSVFVGYSQEGYNLHIWINQGITYYVEPELNRINRIEY